MIFLFHVVYSSGKAKNIKNDGLREESCKQE